ncbi:cyclic pyranopterin monophosphate synthase MoaC [Nitrincola nitratireducens]|uniref:Cyclic pyranopterin monophosphate synthase n=1 Tax=Nitrincola nitratireducens TaxID=1229521 RepID=W9VFU6_9GAMM|nr:cyclic pyranopterin monophosphate synthase MoaC [Nitrincola nitratireducens]EXJ09565.1 Molybdenum cofactor biosynthesis protein C [Nitrincola nitratireducens]
MQPFTHLNDLGQARMVDISEKESSSRVAQAQAVIMMRPQTLSMILEKKHPKGDVLSAARIAGIMAAKKTSDIIPLCHPLLLNKVNIDLIPNFSLPGINIISKCKVEGKTGVEMEALTSVSVAALTIYDMCKSVDKLMEIKNISLQTKVGGKSGNWDRNNQIFKQIENLKKDIPTNLLRIVFFADIKEKLKTESLDLNPSDLTGKTIDDIISHLSEKGDIWKTTLNEKNILCAVNKQLVKRNHVINPSDEIAFFPPVTGG